MNEEEVPIQFITSQEVVNLEDTAPAVKPRKPRVIKKSVTPKKPIHNPAPVIEEKIPEPVNQPKKAFALPPIQNNNYMPREAMGYDTLNPLIYKFVNYLLLPSLLCFAILAILTLANFFLFPTSVLTLYGGIILSVFSLINFILIFIIQATSLKKNDLIIIRKFRSGAGSISRTTLRGKSELLFDKKDPSSKVLISWAGAITDVVSGCKIIQISEGHPTNDNLNSQVTESEWDKDVARLTKAKSIADLAEAELFNQGLFGLKWQDIALIIIAILCVAIIGYLVMGAPDAIAKKTVESLMNGNIQNAVQGVLNNAGILTPAVVK